MTLFIYPSVPSSSLLMPTRPSRLHNQPHLQPPIHLLPPPPSDLRNLPQPTNRAPRRRGCRRAVAIPFPSASAQSIISPQYSIPPPQHKERDTKKPHSPHRPRPPRHRLLAALAAPDPDAVPLDRHLAAKGAGVAGVLADFHLLDLFAEGGAVSGFVLVLEGVLFLEGEG